MITRFKDLVPPPNDLFANTYEMILAFAKVLTGCDIGAQYLVSALASKVITIVFGFLSQYMFICK